MHYSQTRTLMTLRDSLATSKERSFCRADELRWRGSFPSVPTPATRESSSRKPWPSNSADLQSYASRRYRPAGDVSDASTLRGGAAICRPASPVELEVSVVRARSISLSALHCNSVSQLSAQIGRWSISLPLPFSGVPSAPIQSRELLGELVLHGALAGERPDSGEQCRMQRTVSRMRKPHCPPFSQTVPLGRPMAAAPKAS